LGEVFSSDDVIAVLKQKGFYFHHQRGSHMTFKRDIPRGRVTLPRHKEITKGTFASILSQAGLTLKEFKQLLK